MIIPQFDAIVIGTGQAGPSLATRLTEAGMKVAVVDAAQIRRHLRQHRLHADQDPGGERQAAHLARRSGELGVHIEGPVTVDMPKVKARKD